MDASKLVVVSDVDVSKTAGAIVWWRLSEGLPLEALRAAWVARGLDTSWLPAEPAASTALARAVASFREPRTLVRPVPKSTAAWAVVRETFADGSDEPEYRTLFTARLNKVGRPEFVAHDARDVDVSKAQRAELFAGFEHFSNNLIQADVSPWLSRILDRVQAVALRDTGGVYFIPRPQLPVWQKVVAALREATAHAFFSVSALRSDEAVAAISDAITQEATKAADDMMAELAEAALGKRALQNRIAQAGGVEAKLAQYEELLGQKLDALRERVVNVRAGLSVALTKLDIEENGETPLTP